MPVKSDHPSELAYQSAAWLLRCEVRAIKAVAKVEVGPEGAFIDATGEPVILYERHVFNRLTAGRHGGYRAPGLPGAYSLLSSSKPGGYGPVSVQHARLGAAVKLHKEAALKSCSWGLYQIMGENHKQAGYPVLQRFINAMYRGVDDHLRAFVMFIKADYRLVDAIREKDWGTFARIYNGPKHKNYDVRMARAYEGLQGG